MMDQFITDTMDALGYWGVALLMFLENIVPPIPSELVMPAAGASAAKGQQSFLGVVLAGTLGSLLGALPWYWVAYYAGTKRLSAWMERHGHWFGTNGNEIHRLDEWFDRFGHWAVLFGRMVPGARTLISIPAGFSEMPLIRFLAFSLIGTAGWSLLLASLGYWLQGQQQTIAQAVQWTALGVFAVFIVWFVARIVLKRRQRMT